MVAQLIEAEKELWLYSDCWLSHLTFDWGRKNYYLLMESTDRHICKGFFLCWFMLHWCLLLPSIHNISTRFLFHFSLRRWRRRDRALWRSVPECLGLVFQTGSAGWATPYSEGQNPVCNGGWLGSLEAELTLCSLNPSLCCSCLDVLCSRVLTCRPVWTLLLIVAVLCAHVAFLCYLS